MRPLVTATLLCAALVARADEGMWTFDAFPKEKVEQKYGFRPDDRWLDHVRLSSVRLSNGCSGSFVSASGLILTNHHCAHSCIEQLSTARRDHVRDGFHARRAAEERRCPGMAVDQLLSIRDVTQRMNRATAGLEGQRFFDAQRAEIAAIERECQTSPTVRCEVVTLYHGGVYDLYEYRRFDDVRLVFAPEMAIASFGGDPDNFMFPRYDLDVSFLRAYDGGRPARLDHWLRWSRSGPRDGDLTFTSGNPGTTDRLLTVAELEYLRDVALPDRLLDLAELRGVLTEFGRRGPEQRRISEPKLASVENSFKALRGEEDALRDARFFAAKVAAENDLRARLAKDPEQARRYLPAFDAIARAQETLKEIHEPLRWIERGGGFSGRLFEIARALVRGAAERQKPDGQRLRELRESALPALEQRLFAKDPIHDQVEILLLGHSLAKLREHLGPDDPFVRKVLGKRSPQEYATELVNGSRLRSLGLRRALWSGGEAAVAASRDPMIELARRIDADGRAIRGRYEEQVEAVVRQNGELVARARFAAEGTSRYPDATFTPRLSYGQVKGYEENGHAVRPFTDLGGAFERATGRDPYALPPSWLRAQARLDPKIPFDFCTTNDIVGGNSGSPVIGRDGALVGVAFDGNIHSLGGAFGFDEAVNRAVAVDSAAIVEALDEIYGASRLLQELLPSTPHG